MSEEELIDVILELTKLRPRERYAPGFEKAWAKEIRNFPKWAVIEALHQVMSMSDPFIPTTDAVTAELARMGVSAVGVSGASEMTRAERRMLRDEAMKVQAQNDQNRSACAGLSDEEFLRECEAAFADASPDLQALKSLMMAPSRVKRRTPELCAMVAGRISGQLPVVSEAR